MAGEAQEVTIKMPRAIFDGLLAAVGGLHQMLQEAGAKVQQDEQAAAPEEDAPIDDGGLGGFGEELDAASPVR